MSKPVAGSRPRGSSIGEAENALLRLLETHADDVADGAYLAGLALLEEACRRGRDAFDYRWRSSPRTELAALRQRTQLATALVRFAVRVREYDEERWLQRAAESEMLRDLQRQLDESARHARYGERRRRRAT